MALVLHWVCNDNAATTAVVDSSGNGRNGAVEGGITTADATTTGPGNTLTAALAMSSTGGVQRINIDQASLPLYDDNTATLSICAWYNEISDPPSVDRTIVGYEDDDNNRDAHILTSGSQTIKTKVRLAQDEYGNTTLGFNEWHHYVFLIDGTVDPDSFADRALYVDGVLQSATVEDTASSMEWNKVDRFVAGQYLDCKVADVRLYDHVLTESEIKTLYGLGFTGTFASITSPADASNTNHDSGDAGTVLTVTAAGDTPAPTFAVSGTDGAQFNINPTTGVLTFASAPDYSSPTDANADNVYEITLTAVHPAGDDSVNVTVTVVSVGPPVNSVAPVVSKVS